VRCPQCGGVAVEQGGAFRCVGCGALVRPKKGRGGKADAKKPPGAVRDGKQANKRHI